MASTWTQDRTRVAIENLGRERLPWPEFASRLTQQLQRSVGFDGWCLAQTDPATLLPARAEARSSPVAGRQQRFWQIEYHLCDVNQWVALAQAGPSVRTLSEATSGDLARSPRWDELMRPAGISDELRASLTIGGRCWAGLCLFRGSAGHTFTEAQVQHVRQVLGAAAAGARSAWAVHDTISATPPGMGPGTVIVTTSGEVVTATPEAARWLTELSPRSDQSPAIIYALTAWLTASETGRNGSSAARVRTRTAAGQWLDVHASRLAAAMPGCDIAITISPADPQRISTLLMHVHGLSARERQIALLVLGSRSLTEIARALHISVYTAKDHLKAIFRKTGTHSRPELTQRLTGDT